MYEFTTEIELDITGSHNIQSGGGKTKLKWKLELEMREYGIKSFTVIVPDQTITSEVWRYNDETDEEYQEEITIELKDVKVDHSSCSGLQGLLPDRLEIWVGRQKVVFV